MELHELSVAERYRSIASTFSDRVQGVDDWDAPTPVAEWRVRDIVGHLTTWLPGMLAAGSDVRLTPVAGADDDPAGAWAHFDTQLQALLDDPASAHLTYAGEHIGEKPVPDVIDQFFTTDVFLHTWDLARATGQDDLLDETMVRRLRDGMTSAAEMIRGSGQFGKQRALPEGATTQDELIAFIGRDPRWTPDARRSS